MRKIAFIFLLALTCNAAANAETYEYLVFTTAAGEVSMKAEGTKITFSDGNLIAKNAEDTQTLPLSSLSKFYFSDTASNTMTGIDEVSSAPIAEKADVYNISGQRIGSYSYTEGETLPLPEGVYIVKGTSGTKKITVK